MLQQVVHLVTQYGYLAVFVLMLAESACIPVPSEVVMMFGGALAAGAITSAHSAPPSLAGVVVAGVLGNVAGSYLAWLVGKYAGQAAVKRWGRRVGIREHEIDRAVAWFERHGPVAVLVGRVIPVIRTFISLPAGFADMPASRFGLYTALGCIPWTAALGIAGYALGANWDSVAKDFNGPTYAIAGILLVAVVVLLVRRRRARKAHQAGSAVNPGTAAGAPGPDGRAVPAAGAFPGQQPPSPYARGAQGAYRQQDANGPQDAYRPQDGYGQEAYRGPQDAYRPGTAQGPRHDWSDGPEDPWAQPSGRANR